MFQVKTPGDYYIYHETTKDGSRFNIGYFYLENEFIRCKKWILSTINFLGIDEIRFALHYNQLYKVVLSREVLDLDKIANKRTDIILYGS